MKIALGVFLGLISACSFNSQNKEERPLLISQKLAQQYKRVLVQELEANYPLSVDLTPALMNFLSDASRSKARYLSHLTLTTYEGARSCVILVGSEEDMKTISLKDRPMDAPRRIKSDLLSQISKEKIFESKPFCKIGGKAAAKDFVLIQARIYVPQESANQNNAID